MVGFIIILPVIIIVMTIILGFINSVLFKNKSNISIMLLGISIMIFGGTLAVDPSANFGGFEYFTILIGFSFAISGFAKKDNIN